MKLQGYAAVFGRPAWIAGEFKETVRPGAFARTLKSAREVHLIHHHDYRTVLASTQNGTLRLREDSHGLRFEADLADTTAARDLHTLVRRGDVRGMSFKFSVPDASGEIWREGRSGALERDLLDVDLFEVTITPLPCYPDTSVQVMRSDPRAVRNRMMRKRMLARLPARAS